MADDPKANASTPVANAAAAKEAEVRKFDPKRKYIAQRRILHGDAVIFPGKEVPLDIPAASRELLWNGGDIAEAAPAESKTTVKEIKE
ncbi:MAG TPA: hypothetical protein VHM90_03085 [Phycisphaerae bacterium]|nr:hypothetical protein [Phycisphaerae bacterium]